MHLVALHELSVLSHSCSHLHELLAILKDDCLPIIYSVSQVHTDLASGPAGLGAVTPSVVVAVEVSSVSSSSFIESEMHLH